MMEQDNNQEYIHYGADHFDKSLFSPVKNATWGFPKPESGGFWASPADSEWGWKQYCDECHFDKSNFDKSFKFTLPEWAKICHIKSVDNLKKLPKYKALLGSTSYLIDFEKAAKTYDGIQLHLSDEIRDRYDAGLYSQLYGWDCDSLLIMNPDIIEEIQ